MTMAELVQKIEQLPVVEQQEVEDFVRVSRFEKITRSDPCHRALQKKTRNEKRKNNKTNMEVISEIAYIPEEEWANVPTDGAENHDHYLYGAPRKEKS